ncbi:hypothetical protein Acav_2069 [Paracidovorax avenae ATCC 19860]|uniref:Uncharacterized protein n=1 Tax=Paracidovorax avenae (strain ATCC 19860 / DSM 7227 / CCUG 15838 / JCM 20985 / LMG 2117 / NCPPB 1011) TaxID=643561 RepID=F0Q9R6_PARA1|nr:hypothetical protein Acav_2069 [Paracidovorax avenae ATCC 19860]
MNQFKAWANCRHGAMAVALSALFLPCGAAFHVLPKVGGVGQRSLQPSIG